MGYFKGDGMCKLWGIKVYCSLPTVSTVELCFMTTSVVGGMIRI